MANENIMDWKKEFSKKISNLVGYHLGADHIDSDTPGYHYYIRQLKPGHPLILIHYRGPLFAVLPNNDYKELENGTVSVEEYLEKSYFCYGYFWGGGDLTGAYWMPLEDGPNIQDTGKISRYLHILSCRTLKHSSGYSPSTSHCKACKLDCTSCPFSPLNKTGSWIKEVQEYDPRVTFFRKLTSYLKSQGYETDYVTSHTYSNTNRVHLHFSGGFKVVPLVSQQLLNDMLYYPERDWSNILETLTFSK